jgi:hypothetical protein
MINLFNLLRRRHRFEIVEHDNVECLAKALRFTHKPDFVQYAEHHLKKGGMHARRVVVDADILAHCARNTPANCFEIGTHSGRSATILAKNTQNRVWTLSITHELVNDPKARYITSILPTEQIGQDYRKNDCQNVSQIYADSVKWNHRQSEIKDISFCYIDGCHDAKYVHSDTVKCKELALPGALIAWHDFSLNTGQDKHLRDVLYGVDRAYKEKVLSGPIHHVKGSWTGIIEC